MDRKQGLKTSQEIASAELSQAAIDIMGLQRAQERKREEISSSVEALKNAEKNGFIVNSDYGRIVVDVGSYIKGGWQAIKCPTILREANDTLIKWPGERQKSKGFFISAGKDFDDNAKALAQKEGLIVRGNMWLKPPAEEPPKISLAEILFAMGVPESEITKSRNLDGKFNPRSLFAQIQREQGRTGQTVYPEVASYQRNRGR